MKPSPFRLGFFISQKTLTEIVVRIVVNYLKNTPKSTFCSNIEINPLLYVEILCSNYMTIYDDNYNR